MGQEDKDRGELQKMTRREREGGKVKSGEQLQEDEGKGREKGQVLRVARGR